MANHQIQTERKQRKQAQLTSLRADMTFKEVRHSDAKLTWNVVCKTGKTNLLLKELGYDLPLVKVNGVFHGTTTSTRPESRLDISALVSGQLTKEYSWNKGFQPTSSKVEVSYKFLLYHGKKARKFNWFITWGSTKTHFLTIAIA